MICETCGKAIRDDAAFCPHCGARVPGGPTYDDYAYEAFISYRHLERDTKIATRLQRSLEGYRLPRGIARADDGATRLGKLFRDQDELPTSQSLGDQIEGALKRSRRLVVICTPQTNESQWVQREVELYASFHGRDAIVIALAAGEPSESFPTLMRSRLVQAEDGTVVSVEEEPIAADFRDGTRKQFDLERLRVAASIIGCGFDELRQRQHARRMRVIAAATSAVAVLSTAFGSFSLWQQHQIEENYRQTQIRESESLAVESAELLEQGDRMQAIQVALAALPQSSTSDDRPFVPAAQLALERALQVYPTKSYWRSCYSIDDVEGTYAACEEGLQAFLKTDGTILVTNINDGLEVCSFDPVVEVAALKPDASEEDLREECKFAFCGDRLIWWNGKLYALFDARTGKAQWVTVHKNLLANDNIIEELANELTWNMLNNGLIFGMDTVNEQVYPSPDGKQFAVTWCNTSMEFEDGGAAYTSYETPIVVTIDIETGEAQRVYQLPAREYDKGIPTNRETIRLAYSPDGTTMAVANYGKLHLLDLASGEVKTEDLQQPYAYSVDFAGDAIVAISAESSGVTEIYITPIDDGAYIDVFDTDLKPLWHATEKPPKRADAELTQKPTRAFVAGTTNDTGDLIVAVGYSLIIYHHSTGKEVRRIQTTEPIASCQNLNGALCYVDSAGHLNFASAEADTIANAIDHFGLQVPQTDKATFTLSDRYYAAQWNSDTSSYRVYRATNRYDSPGMDPFDGSSLIPLDNLWYWGSKPTEKGGLLLESDGSLVLIDLETLETSWRVPKDARAGDNIRSAVIVDQSIALVSEVGSDRLRISLLSWDDGSLLDLFEPKVESTLVYDLATIERDGTTYLMLKQPKVHRMYDLSTHKEVTTYAREDEESMALSWYTDDAILSVSLGEDRRTYQVISLDTGERVPADIDECVVPGWEVGSVAADLLDDGSQFATVDVAGTVRLYDTTDWSLVWESTEQYPKAQHLAFSKDGQHLLLQSLTGTCLLLSAQDGSVVAVSSTVLPTITSSYYTDDDTLVAYYTTDGVRPTFGTALVSLDPERFGPVDDVFCGQVFTYAKQRVFTFDQSADRVVVLNHYTLDELIELAQQTVQGHELTDAERHLYRID